jgi:formylglycine-generating enzyme required for sulfatase activity
MRYLASQVPYGADENNQVIYEYFINEKEVNQEEFNRFMEVFDNKEDAVWCEFPNHFSGQNLKKE